MIHFMINIYDGDEKQPVHYFSGKKCYKSNFLLIISVRYIPFEVQNKTHLLNITAPHEPQHKKGKRCANTAG